MYIYSKYKSLKETTVFYKALINLFGVEQWLLISMKSYLSIFPS